MQLIFFASLCQIKIIRSNTGIKRKIRYFSGTLEGMIYYECSIFMRKMYLTVTCLAGVVLILIFLFIKGQPCSGVNCIEITDMKNYKIKQVYENNPYIFRALYQKGESLLRLEIRKNLTKIESDDIVRSQITKTKGLFEDAAAPYPGEISDQVHCSDEFKPVYSSKKQNGIDMSYFTAFVNDRLTFGSCIADQANYQDTMVMFYCPKQKISIQMEVLLPREEYLKNPGENKKIQDSIGCKE